MFSPLSPLDAGDAGAAGRSGAIEHRSQSTSMQTSHQRDTYSLHSLPQSTEDDDACFMLSRDNALRLALRSLVTTSRARLARNALTLCYCLLLGVLLSDPAFQRPRELEVAVTWAECVVVLVLAAEVLLCFVAFGVCLHKSSWLRSSVWHCTDFIAVAVGCLQLLDAWRYSPWVRSVRVLLLLRLITESPPLHRVVSSLRRALPLMFVNLVLVVFVTVIFAVLAVKSWTGELDKKCYAVVDEGAASEHLSLIWEPVDWPCGSGVQCPESITVSDVYTWNVTCAVDLSKYQRSHFNFNSIPTAFLVFLRVISLDDVSRAISDVMAMSGKPFSLFIIALVVATSFLSMNIFLAILVDAFSGNHDLAESLQTQINSAGPSSSTPTSATPASSHRLRDVQTQVSDADITAECEMTGVHRDAADASALHSIVDPSRVVTIDEFLHSPESVKVSLSQQKVSLSNSASRADDLPPWSRRIPLSLSDAIARRGFWAAVTELECTTSRPAVSGKLSVALVKCLHSRTMVVTSFALSVINVGCLCGLHNDMHAETRDILINTTIGASLFFVFPLCVKFIIYSPLQMWHDLWNLVDLLAVTSAVFELSARGMFAEYALLEGTRTLRLIRIGKYISQVERFTRSIFPHWLNVIHLFVCFSGFLLTYAAVGMLWFGDSYRSAPPTLLYSPEWSDRMARDSFKTLWESLLVCFVVLSGDRWATRLQLAMQQDNARAAASLVFFITLYFVGNFLIINIFTALLTEATSQTLTEEAADNNLEQPPQLLLPLCEPKEKISKTADARFDRRATRSSVLVKDRVGGKQQFSDIIQHDTEEQNRFFSWLLDVQEFKVIEDSFFVFSPSDDVRRLSLILVGSTVYKVVMLAAVVANTVALLFESAFNDAPTNDALSVVFLVLLVAFWFEIILKMIAFGVVFPAPEKDPSVWNPHAPAFFRDPWNNVDFVVNSLCLAAQIFPSMRAAVALRTLRFASWSANTRRILTVMLESLPRVLNALVIILYFIVIFGVLGVQIFSGRFFRCSDPTYQTEMECSGNRTQVWYDLGNLTFPRVWGRSPYHFDSFPSAALSLFIVSTGGYWSDIMYDGMDVGNKNDGLRTNQNPLYCLYFVTAYMLLNIFALKLAVAVLINFFAKSSKQRDGSWLLTPEQQQYVKARDTIDALLFDVQDALEPREASAAARKVHRLLNYSLKRSWLREPLVDTFVRVFVWISSAVMLTYHRDTLDFEYTLRDTVDLFGFGVFSAEAALRLFAYGPAYFSVTWNIVDAAMLPLIFAGVMLPQAPPYSFFRAIVLLKLPKNTRIERLLWSIAKNFAQFGYVLFLLFIVYFIYAAAGVIIFGNLANVPPGTNTFVNFRNVPSALLTLFLCSTSRSWEPVLDALSESLPGCAASGSYQNDCGSQQKAVTYIVTFMILAVFGVSHLLAAVVVEIFRSNLDRSEPTIAAFFELKDVWQRAFGLGTTTVHIDEFLVLLPGIPVLLTGLTFGRRAAFVRLVASLHIPIDSKHCIRYRDVVRAFAWRRYKVETRTALLVFRERLTLAQQRSTEAFTVAHALGARIIQRMYRQYKQKEREAYQQKMLAMRRHLLRRGGTYDDGEESVVDAVNEDGGRRRTSLSRHHSFSHELMNMFESLRLDQQPLELRIASGRGIELPRGAAYIPDSSLFAFGPLQR